MAQSFRRILVGISDTSQPPKGLLKAAARLAGRPGVRLFLIHTYTPLPQFQGRDGVPLITTDKRSYEVAARKQLEKFAAPLRRKRIAVTTVVVEDMPPHEALVRQVRRVRADLLMMQLHRHPRWARWFVTYTDWELIRQCPCPVWMVKSPDARAVRHIAAAVDPMHPRAGAARIDDRILEAAIQVSQILRSRMTLCHVADLPFAYEPGGVFGEPVPVPTPPDVQRRYMKRVEARIDALARRHGLAKSPRKIVPGLPADLLPRMVGEVRADLLVMGAVSRSGIDRLFLGNLAERLIDRVACDLLIVKPRGFRSRVPTRRRTTGTVVA